MQYPKPYVNCTTLRTPCVAQIRAVQSDLHKVPEAMLRVRNPKVLGRGLRGEKGVRVKRSGFWKGLGFRV